MDQLMRLVDNEIMDRPTHHNTRSLFTASAHPTCIIAIIICRLKCYKGQQKQKKQQRDKRVHCTFYGIYTASQDCFCQKYVVQMILGRKGAVMVTFSNQLALKKNGYESILSQFCLLQCTSSV